MEPVFEQLKVWQLAHQLVLKVYKATSTFPSSERYGIVAQLRRAAIAVPTNIVEGNARRHAREYAQFCTISRASATEVKYLLRLSMDLSLLSREAHDPLSEGYDQVGKMLFSLIRKLA